MASKFYMLFPGQGSQYVGMCRKIAGNPAVRRLFDKASEVLQYNLLKICLEGPEKTLEDTIHCQPAVVVASLAAVEQLRKEKPQILDECIGTAGYSVGEITSLIFGKAISLEDGLDLVKTRAESMQTAALRRKGTMASIFGLNLTQVNTLCKDAESATSCTVCIASHLFNSGSVVSGDRVAVEHVKSAALEMNAQRINDLSVSGAFHSPLMLPAVPSLQEAFSTCPICTPHMVVYSNVSGMPHTDPNSIRTQLVQQITSSIKWNACMEDIIGRNPDISFVECGPGRQLKTLLGRINKTVFKKTLSWEV